MASRMMNLYLVGLTLALVCCTSVESSEFKLLAKQHSVYRDLCGQAAEIGATLDYLQDHSGLWVSSELKQAIAEHKDKLKQKRAEIKEYSKDKGLGGCVHSQSNERLGVIKAKEILKHSKSRG